MSKLLEFGPVQAFSEDKQALIGHLNDFMNRRQGADVEQVSGLGRIHARLTLRDYQNGLFLPQRIDELNRAFPSYR